MGNFVVPKIKMGAWICCLSDFFSQTLRNSIENQKINNYLKDLEIFKYLEYVINKIHRIMQHLAVLR